jgi:Family of unknown function (DUF5675)
MLLTLLRTELNAEDTIGELSIDDGPRFCYTLELPSRDGLPGSAIPPGVYPVVLVPSPKFLGATDPWILRYASQMPRLIRIPDRSNILIHWGNEPQNTEGCILVGLEHPSQDFIGSSRAAFEQLFAIIEQPARANDLRIQVIGGAPQPPAPPAPTT